MTAVVRDESNRPGVQVIDVTVDKGFHPSVIRARPGLPLRLALHRLDASECAARIVFSEPRIERHLALEATTVIELPALSPGEIRFTCGMGRYAGRIEVEQASGRSLSLIRRRTGARTRLVAAGADALLAVLALVALGALVVAQFAVAALATALLVIAGYAALGLGRASDASTAATEAH